MIFDLTLRLRLDVSDEFVISGPPARAIRMLEAYLRVKKAVRLVAIYYARDIDIFDLMKLESVSRDTPPSKSSDVAVAPVASLRPGTVAFIVRPDEGLKHFEEATFWNEPAQPRVAVADSPEDDVGGQD